LVPRLQLSIDRNMKWLGKRQLAGLSDRGHRAIGNWRSYLLRPAC
jgi:hypothetical protein